jgi:hypothetical protein
VRNGLGRYAALAIGIVVVVGTYLVFFAPSGAPASAAQVPIARTEMTGPIALDMVAEDGAEVPATSPAGEACLERLVREAGWADVCWGAYREPQDADRQKDYYTLRVYGSYQGTGVLGIKWLIVKSRLLEPPLQNVFDGWPAGTYDGQCEQQPVSLMISSASSETAMVCGHTTSGPGTDWSWTRTWTCSPCAPFDTATRAFDLYTVVGVTPGTVPSWDVFVDFGS